MVKTVLVANWTPLRDALSRVEQTTTYSWADLDALVGGFPPSAYVHSAFWKGSRSGWRGFRAADVRVGEKVTFIREGSVISKPTSTRRARVTPPASSMPPADPILAGCVKEKLNHSARARDLYTSDLFRKERAYAERSGVPWFVLSAQHGLVDPDEELEPYDLHLAKTSAAYRQSWGGKVVQQLHHRYPSLDGKVIEIHAGSAYTDAIRDLLVAQAAQVVEPLRGLTHGKRLAWYRAVLEVEL